MQAAFSQSALKQANATTFNSLSNKLDPGLLTSLETMKYDHMTPVQEKILTSLPTLATDCLVQAKTGTGKTIAFLLPALQSLITSRPLPEGQVAILVLVPTRELAIQIAEECDCLTAQLQRPVQCHTAYGGSARASALAKFMSGSPTVLVATPGRLQDYMGEAQILAKFAHLRTVILDEADRMLEQGFLQDVKRILQLLPPKSSGWQGMCFSATVPASIKPVLNLILRPNYATISTVDEKEPPTHARVPQYHVLMTGVGDTLVALSSLLTHEIEAGGSHPKIIVFGITARLVSLYKKFYEQVPGNLPVYEVQSRMNQNARIRAINNFKKATEGIIFATDVIGRGMDFPDVSSVIQVGLPMNGFTYIHRVGRTGRVDKGGRAVILLTQKESFFLAKNPRLPIQPYPKEIDLPDRATASRIMAGIDEETKGKAYAAYLGFMKTYRTNLGLSREELVAMANQLATEAFECPDIPPVGKMLAAKMGLKGVEGLRVDSTHNDRKAARPPGGNRGGRGGRQARSRDASDKISNMS